MVTQATLRTCEGKQVMFQKKNRFVNVLDQYKCLNQIRSLNMYAPISKLPSNIKTLTSQRNMRQEFKTCCDVCQKHGFYIRWLLIFHYVPHI